MQMTLPPYSDLINTLLQRRVRDVAVGQTLHPLIGHVSFVSAGCFFFSGESGEGGKYVYCLQCMVYICVIHTTRHTYTLYYEVAPYFAVY